MKSLLSLDCIWITVEMMFLQEMRMKETGAKRITKPIAKMAISVL